MTHQEFDKRLDEIHQTMLEAWQNSFSDAFNAKIVAEAKQAIRELFVDVVEGARWHASDNVYTENRRQRDMVLDELRTTITGKEGGDE